MKKLGFGMMRLPMIEKEVDTEQVCRMVDIIAWVVWELFLGE